MHKILTHFLDTAIVLFMTYGIITLNGVILVLGGLASIAAIINHVDQFIKRRKK